MNFKVWIAKYQKTNKPIGDLARDIAGDKEFPDTNDCEKVLDHLMQSHACEEAIATFKNA